jgi:NADH-quinone oxidoreductase subunit E
MTTTQRTLTPEMVAKIEALAPRYPNRRALTLPALHIVNDALRYVPLEAVVEVAELLGLAPAEVQDTLSFYQFFPQDKPSGETRAWVCRSVSCALRGGEEVLEHICRTAGIEPYGTTADGSLTVEPAECLGACDFAPCMLAGRTLHKNLTKESAEAFVRAARTQAAKHS